MLSRALTLLAYIFAGVGALLFVLAYETFEMEDRAWRRLRVVWKRSKVFTYVRSFMEKRT